MLNNSYAQSNNFVYRKNSLNDCMIEIERTHVDREYALQH